MRPQRRSPSGRGARKAPRRRVALGPQPGRTARLQGPRHTCRGPPPFKPNCLVPASADSDPPEPTAGRLPFTRDRDQSQRPTALPVQDVRSPSPGDRVTPRKVITLAVGGSGLLTTSRHGYCSRSQDSGVPAGPSPSDQEEPTVLARRLRTRRDMSWPYGRSPGPTTDYPYSTRFSRHLERLSFDSS